MFELMDLALLMVRQHLSGYAWITVIMVAGMAALNGSILYVIDWHALASIILIVVEAPLLGLPLIIYSADLLFNDRPSAIEALKRSWQVFPKMLLEYVPLRILLYVLPLGFIIYQFRYRFSTEVVVLEQLSGTRKRDRLRFLQTHDRHGAGLTLVLYAVGLLSVLGGLYTSAMIQNTFLGQFRFDQTLSAAPGLMLIHIIGGLIIAYSYVVGFVDYIDVRTSKEGWDLSLELRMASLS